MPVIKMLSGKDLDSIVDPVELIQVIEDCLIKFSKGKSLTPNRTVMWINNNWWGVMPSYVVDSGVGIKIVSVIPENREKGLPSIPGIVIIFDEITGLPVAAMDGAVETGLRTAAASALSVKYLKPNAGGILTVLGAGFQARYHIKMISSIYDIEKIKVFDVLKSQSQSFKVFCEKLGFDTVIVDSSRKATTDASIILETSTTKFPVIFRDALLDKVHIVSIGAHTHDSRAIDDLVIKDSDLILVDSKEATYNETGDIRLPIEKGIIKKEDLIEIGEYMDVKDKYVRDKMNLTIYKSVGIAAMDTCAGKYLYKKSIIKKVGLEAHI